MATIIIDHPSQLNSLSTIPGIRPIPRGTISLGGAMEKHEKRGDWETRLNNSYRACGCGPSAALLLVGVVLALGTVGYQALSDTATFSIGTAALKVFAAGAVGAAIGKFYGLFRANSDLKKTAAELQAIWKVETPSSTQPNIVCG